MSARERELATTEDGDASELTYETLQESPLKRWVLLDGHRLLIAGLVAAGLYVAVVALELVGLVRVGDVDGVVTLLGALVGGTLPFITIVLAINQLVLSQELGWTGDLRERFEEMVAFQRDVEELTDVSVSPASPAAFLEVVVLGTVDRARELPDALVADVDPDRRAEVERFVESIERDGAEVAETLSSAEFGTFDALSAVLGHHQGNYLHAARTFDRRWEESFADTEPLEELVELLGYLAVARQTFKTLYVQHELAVLSRMLLYVGFPTLVGGGLTMIAYPSIAAAAPNRAALLVVAAAAITLVFLPFVVLLSYALRIATIAARTADFGPFVPRSRS